jgi:hypothetical protein
MTSSSHLAAAEQASGSANGLKEASLLAQRDSLDRALLGTRCSIAGTPC